MTTTPAPPRTRPDELRRNLAWLAAHPDLAAYAYSTTTTTHDVTLQCEADQGFRILAGLPLGAQLVERSAHKGFAVRIYRLDGVLVRIVVEADQ